MSDIFRRMKKPVITAVFVLFAALPLAAQSAEFGFLIGGSRSIGNPPGATDQQTTVNDFRFGGAVKELYYGTKIDPDTVFRIRIGEVDVPVVYNTGTTDPANNNRAVFASARGTITHIDAIADYRFSESFGSTGIFGGLGMYRTHVAQAPNDTNAGITAGINADFPVTRRYSFMVEASGHWLHTRVRQRFVTITGGLRVSF
jgi:hypothetical protein